MPKLTRSCSWSNLEDQSIDLTPSWDVGTEPDLLI